MIQRDNILQELNELESTLAAVPFRNVYQAPAGYFENLAGLVINRIREMETENAREEPALLPPGVNNLERITPYQVPPGYFDGLAKRLVEMVQQEEKEQTPQQELEYLSPLLSSLKKQTPYSVPEGYFDKLVNSATPAETPVRAKVVSINARRLFRYAAAAVVITFVTIGGFLFLNRNGNVDPNEKSYVWVKENMDKVSTDELDEFITAADKETAASAVTGQTEEIKELMKNISDREIQDFLNDTEIIAADTEDILLN